MTRVTIVGAGNMGRGSGTRVVAGGHQVEIVDHTFAGTLVPGEVGGQQLGFLHISLLQPFDLGFGSAIKLVLP